MVFTAETMDLIDHGDRYMGGNRLDSRGAMLPKLPHNVHGMTATLFDFKTYLKAIQLFKRQGLQVEHNRQY